MDIASKSCIVLRHEEKMVILFYTRKDRASFVITISNVNWQRESCVIFSCFTEFMREEKQKKKFIVVW